jgi:hypothetical protein
LLFILIRRPTLLFRILPLLIKNIHLTVPFFARHNTVHAYTHGAGAAVKYGLVPCKSQPMPAAPKSQANFVTELSQAVLDRDSVCMDIQIQRQRDPCTDSLDNLVTPWTGPWETVARLNIPKGTKIQNDDYCEKLSMNPFHAHAENRPLGWIAEVRRLYSTMSATRQ